MVVVIHGTSNNLMGRKEKDCAYGSTRSTSWNGIRDS